MGGITLGMLSSVVVSMLTIVTILSVDMVYLG